MQPIVVECEGAVLRAVTLADSSFLWTNVFGTEYKGSRLPITPTTSDETEEWVRKLTMDYVLDRESHMWAIGWSPADMPIGLMWFRDDTVYGLIGEDWADSELLDNAYEGLLIHLFARTRKQYLLVDRTGQSVPVETFKCFGVDKDGNHLYIKYR